MTAPTVSAVSPVIANPQRILAGLSVTVTGTGFFNGGSADAVTAVHFGATAAAAHTATSDTTLVVTVPAHAAGTIDVTVTTPGGTSATSSADEFTYGPTVATQAPGPPGAVITFQAANAAPIGDTFINDGRTLVQIANASGSPITATVVGKIACSQGFLHNEVITVAAGATETAGPFPTSQFTEPGTGFGYVTYSATTSVTIAAVGL